MNTLMQLVEDTIGTIQSRINVVMNLDKTHHASDRQSRHANTFIEDEDIKDTIDAALPKIARALMFNDIDVGDSVLIHNRATSLNVVGVLKEKRNMLDFVVVTVMEKRNFKAKRGTYVINI